MRARTDIDKVNEVIDLKKLNLTNKEISGRTNLSEATVSRILRQKNTYLSDDKSWESDKIIGKRCNDCGVIFAYRNNKVVVCKTCYGRRKLLGLPEIPISRFGEI